MRVARRVASPSLQLLHLVQLKEAPLNEACEIAPKSDVRLCDLLGTDGNMAKWMGSLRCGTISNRRLHCVDDALSVRLRASSRNQIEIPVKITEER